MHLIVLVETVDGVGLGDAFFFVLGLDVFFFAGTLAIAVDVSDFLAASSVLDWGVEPPALWVLPEF